MNITRLRAPAKINLFLEVTGKRKDGYHDLATIFARTTLADQLCIKSSSRPGISLKVLNRSNLVLSRTEDNIVYKAAQRFFEVFGIKPAVKIELVKRVPVGAGLGGGSSDAAAALKALSIQYDVGIIRNAKKLRAIAEELGSDVPFFMGMTTFAAGTGRGEVLRPFGFRGSLPVMVLVFPGVSVNTGSVYRVLKPVPMVEKNRNVAKFKKFIKVLRTGMPFERWPEFLFNRLEEPVLPVYKAVRSAKEDLIKAGAKAVLMSGSGSSVFALVPDRAAAARLAKKVKKPGRKVFLTNFC